MCLVTRPFDEMIEEPTEAQKPAATPLPAGPLSPSQNSELRTQNSVEPLAPTITIDQFAAVDLRVAKILTAEPVEKSDKLIKLTLDAGPLGTRTILAGIKKAYTPDRL